jgi:hypothetical protein
MKLAKYFATAAVLVSLLPLSGLAGDLQTPGCVQDSGTSSGTQTTQSSSGSTSLDTFIVEVVNVLLGTVNP